MLRCHLIVLGTLLLLGFGADARGDDGELQKTIARSAEQFIAAVKDRNAESLAALFTEQAEYIDSEGIVFHGRGAIEAEFTARFEVASAGTMEIEVLSIRPIAEGVVVEDGISTFVASEGGAASQTRYTVTHVRQADGKWLMASVRELDSGRMTPHDRLRSLAWLVGQWHEDVPGQVITTEWNWSADGNYLISHFEARRGPEEWSGTHRIGWDAERKQFRSWIFESGGGTLEGWWGSNDDGTWSVNLSGLNDDGVRISGLLGYEPDGPDAIWVTQTMRTLGGENLPSTSHRVVRKPPAPAVKSTERP